MRKTSRGVHRNASAGMGTILLQAYYGLYARSNGIRVYRLPSIYRTNLSHKFGGLVKNAYLPQSDLTSQSADAFFASSDLSFPSTSVHGGSYNKSNKKRVLQCKCTHDVGCRVDAPRSCDLARRLINSSESKIKLHLKALLVDCVQYDWDICVHLLIVSNPQFGMMLDAMWLECSGHDRYHGPAVSVGMTRFHRG